jgi:methyl-accepting chemotaxis protein
MLAIIAIERAVSHGVAKQKLAEIASKVDEMEETIESAVNKFAAHMADTNIHITPTLTELFKVRGDYMQQAMTDVRRDVRRIEDLLNKM